MFAKIPLQRKFGRRNLFRSLFRAATEGGHEPDRDAGDDLVVRVEEVRGLVQKRKELRFVLRVVLGKLLNLV